MLPRPSLPPLQKATSEDAATLFMTWALAELGQEAEQWWAGEVRPPLRLALGSFVPASSVRASFDRQV